MLILSRTKEQSILIDRNIKIKILDIGRGQVKTINNIPINFSE